jgi:integrase
MRAAARVAICRAGIIYRPIETMNNTAWQSWPERCGLHGFRVHDLRHTVGMRLREAGVPESTRADIL